MKVIPRKNAHHVHVHALPIPYERKEQKKLSKDECLALKLKTDPADANSQDYELTIAYFNNGTPKQWLKFLRDLKKALVGMNVTTGPNKYGMARRLLEGEALAHFNNAATANGNETNANFTLCLQAVTKQVFPQQALLKQKRAIRRYMRKPVDVTIRQHVARIVELVNLLPQFPPFGNNQTMEDDEIVEILEFGVPNSWKKQMLLQGFDPIGKPQTSSLPSVNALKVPRNPETTRNRKPKRRRSEA